MREWILLAALSSVLLLAGCGQGDSDDVLVIAAIETPENLFADELDLTPTARHLRAATHAGLVAMNARGEVIPAVAERWIVSNDGLSFIFRLRDGAWPDGSELSAESVEIAMSRALRSLRGTSLGLDLAAIEEVRAMAGRVVEIRLSSPSPTLLQILAQPELALLAEDADFADEGLGDMRLQVRDSAGVLRLKPPIERGLPHDDNWGERVRPIQLHAAEAGDAIERFHAGGFHLVLGGRLDTWPLADTRPLSRGTVRIDPALGLFGLQVRRATGVLASPHGREAIAMAIDRPALVAPFNIGGWIPTTRVVPPGLPGDPGFLGERWAGEPIEERRAQAARRVLAWRSANDGEAASLTIALESGAGFDVLFRQLAQQLGAIGIGLQRVEAESEADLVLVDRVARYASPRWFLNQFHCSLERGLCDESVDTLASDALAVGDSGARARLLARAELELTLANLYMPFGQPLRWSLVRSGISEFVPNQWAFHPLPPLARIAR